MKQLVNLMGRRGGDRSRTTGRRFLRSEVLEKRQLMAADFAPAHNYAIPEDVNGDWKISPLDALIVLNHISREGAQSEMTDVLPGQLDHFYDVSGTNDINPLDALQVLNRLSTGEGVGELLKLEVNARTAADGAFSASAFNTTTRQLTIGVGEIFNLEVLYRDLRTPVNRIGAFAIYADLLYDAANANNLQPVLTETQFLELSANLIDASTGTIDFTYPNSTSVVSVPFDDFALNQAGSIQGAIQSLGYSNVSVQALGRSSTDPFRYLIRYNDFTLADQDLPNLIVTPRLDLAVTSTVTDEKPRNQDGSINSRAVPLNINFDSRTLPASAGDTFFGFAGTQVGNFSAATGFTDVGATGPLLTTGWPGLNTGTPLPNPFDAFSIPVKMTKNVTDMRLIIDPPNTSATANLFYGRDEPIPSNLIVIDTASSPATAAGATGVIFITATGGEVVTIDAADGSLDPVQNGPAVPIDLRQLVTVTGTTEHPTISIKTPPTKGTLSVVNGIYQYTPNPGAIGADTFVYTANVDGVSDDGTIFVMIDPEQVQLTAGNGELTTFQNGLPVSINLATLVTATPANTPVTYSIVQNPSFGQVGLTSNSLATYTPPIGQSGPTSFRYRVTSVNDPTVFAEGVINVTVNQEITINAQDGQYTAIQGGPSFPITLFPNGLVQTSGTAATPQITLNLAGVKGTVTVNNGVITYKPPTGPFGTDTFSYTAALAAISPGFAGASDTGTITITEEASITARPTTVTAIAGDPSIQINLGPLVTTTGTNNQPTFTINTAGLQGTAVLNGSTVTYTPPVDEFQVTTFTYTASVDGKSSTATVTISEGVAVITGNTSIVAYPGGPAVVTELSPLVTVTGSDASPTFAIASPPSVGQASVNPTTGRLTYTPPATGNWGSINFTYRATVEGVSSVGTITVTQLTVNANDAALTVNEPQPGATPQSGSVDLTSTVSVNIPVGYTITQQPSLGTASISGNRLTYTPRGFVFNQTAFTDTIVFRATAGGVSDTATVQVTINPVVLPPVANNDSFRVTSNVPTTFPASRLTDNDIPARPLSGQGVQITAFQSSTTLGGTLVRNPNGSFTYTPPSGAENVDDSFTYTITSNGQTSTATATLELSPFVPSRISGKVFTDYIASATNPVRNGIQDPNEPSIGGVTIVMAGNAADNVLGVDVNERVLTDADGVYTLPDVAPGSYTITFQVPPVLIFGTRVSQNPLVSGGAGPTFRITIGQDGGVDATGLNYTVLGRRGTAAGSGSLLVSDYIDTNPNSPGNLNNPKFGVGTFIVNPTTGQQQLFELGKGYENVQFAEVGVDASGATALLTLVMDDGSVKTYFLSKEAGDFIVSSNRSVIRVLKNPSSLTPLDSVTDGNVAMEAYGQYRDDVDKFMSQFGGMGGAT